MENQRISFLPLTFPIKTLKTGTIEYEKKSTLLSNDDKCNTIGGKNNPTTQVEQPLN